MSPYYCFGLELCAPKSRFLLTTWLKGEEKEGGRDREIENVQKTSLSQLDKETYQGPSPNQ
jgi:hypothetical protein